MQTLSADAESNRPPPSGRPEVSVYWRPGCSSCLKTKEFMEENGIVYESVNVEADADAMKEVLAAGLRSIPVVRRGETYIYAQSLEDVAKLVGVTRAHERLPQEELLDRWEKILDHAWRIVSEFDDDLIARCAIAGRKRSVKDLASHVFQIPEAFMLSLEDQSIDARALGAVPRENIRTRADLIAYIEAMVEKYRAWRAQGGGKRIPERMLTFYGNQPSSQVLERAVWHSAQHTRQLDHIAAGLGAELRVPPELYAGLPMPKRLWA